MINKRYILIAIMFSFANISMLSQSPSWDYPYNVGDIVFDSTTDNPAFELIDETKVLPYNTECGMMIEGERYRVIEYFSDNFNAKLIERETGYLIIRFIVNYKGKTGRFRMYEMNEKFDLMTFDKSISTQIFSLTKKLSGWKPVIDQTGKQYDYYQYIVFKIKNGLIEYILP